MLVQKVPKLVPMTINGIMLIANIAAMTLYSCYHAFAVNVTEFFAPHLYAGKEGGMNFKTGNLDEFELFGHICSQAEFVVRNDPV